MPEIPFAFQWAIAEDELLPLKNSDYGCLCSVNVSNIPEFQYYMEIFPNGDVEERRGQTWIFLHLEFKNVKKVEADFTFTIESVNFSKANHYVYEESYGRGIGICETNEFFDPGNKCIVDGKFIIKYSGIFKYETEDETIPAATEQKWIGGELGNELWEKNGSKDFIIITADGGKEIKVHKLILENRSDVFTAMLNSNMKESTENKVTIPNFPFIVVETAFKIIYNCNFTTKLSINELMLLLQFFDQYQLPALKAKIEPFLIAQISASNVVRLVNCSFLTNSLKLKEKCMEFLMVVILSQTPFADIDDLDKDVLLEVVKNNFYQILQTEK